MRSLVHSALACALILAVGSGTVAASAPTTAEECAARGGSWRRMGMAQTEVCEMPTGDAGKPCSDSSECESYCVAPEGVEKGAVVTGTCHGTFLRLGYCFAEVTKGHAEQSACRD